MTSAHDFTFTAIDGEELRLAAFAGKAVLIVNTASQCGFTPQYEGLEELHNRYGDKGLVVLGVPCNDFGGQEPGTEGEIATFCETGFGVTFPMTSKQRVVGDRAHPFFAWAREEMGEDNAPQWNFHKYVVGPDGDLRAAIGTRTAPTDAEVIGAVEDALPA